jgi:hypothetical protein
MIPVSVQLLLVLSVAVSPSVAASVRRARAQAPGVRPLLGTLLAVALWSGAYLRQLQCPLRRREQRRDGRARAVGQLRGVARG